MLSMPKDTLKNQLTLWVDTCYINIDRPSTINLFKLSLVHFCRHWYLIGNGWGQGVFISGRPLFNSFLYKFSVILNKYKLFCLQSRMSLLNLFPLVYIHCVLLSPTMAWYSSLGCFLIFFLSSYLTVLCHL